MRLASVVGETKNLGSPNTARVHAAFHLLGACAEAMPHLQHTLSLVHRELVPAVFLPGPRPLPSASIKHLAAAEPVEGCDRLVVMSMLRAGSG